MNWEAEAAMAAVAEASAMEVVTQVIVQEPMPVVTAETDAAVMGLEVGVVLGEAIREGEKRFLKAVAALSGVMLTAIMIPEETALAGLMNAEVILRAVAGFVLGPDPRRARESR